MSAHLKLAPFALAADGTVLVNVAKVADSVDFDAVVRAAARDRRTVFVGVALSRREAELAMGRLDNAADETAAVVFGQRRRRAKRRTRTTTS